MSIIETPNGAQHKIVPLTKGLKAFTGQRLARVIAKKNQKGEYESPNLTQSMAVSVPTLTPADVTDEHIKAMMPHILEMLCDAQDGIVKDAIVSRAATTVSSSELSVDACIAAMESGTSSRITTEYLQSWFMETYADAAYVFVAGVCKFDPDADSWTEAQLEVIEVKTNVLRDMFAGWAGGKYRPDLAKCRGMIRFGEYLTQCDADVDARMTAMLRKAQERYDVLMAEVNGDALGL